MDSDHENNLNDYYDGDLEWVDEAGEHLIAAIRIYRAHVRPDDNGGPDASLLRYTYDLQGAIE